MRTALLDVSANTIIDSAGNGTVVIGPATYGQSWSISLITVQCSSVSPSQFRLYRNSALPQNLIGSTYNGNQDSDTSDSIPDLQYGERLVGVWSVADSGSTAFIVINGQIKDVR